MSIRVVHVISTLDRINFGIWYAAIFGAKRLMTSGNVDTLALICTAPHPVPKEVDIPVSFCTNSADALKNLSDLGFLPGNTIVMTHGCWLMPTGVGAALKSGGYKWIYVPHGMLETWSLSNRRFKKMLYWSLREKHMAQKADAVRAVSKNESVNLSDKLHRKIELVENGVEVKPYQKKSADNVINFLFMGRLHHKKGLLPLVLGWHAAFGNSPNKKLIIAGPDQGELEKIEPHIRGNIEYVGPVYGEGKEALLRNAHYFLLPSFSEGFPVSVLEAMSYGLVPLISSGCNFDDVFQNNLGFRIEPDVENIEAVLRRIGESSFDHELSKKNWLYINDNYSEPVIANRLLTLYQGMM